MLPRGLFGLVLDDLGRFTRRAFAAGFVGPFAFTAQCRIGYLSDKCFPAVATVVRSNAAVPDLSGIDMHRYVVLGRVVGAANVFDVQDKH